MQSAPVPLDEPERLAALLRYQILDTAPDPSFDGLVRLAATFLGVPVALVSLVDSERQWFKAHHGTPLCETTREVSFCAHAVATRVPLVVENAVMDPRFNDNPLVVGPPNIRFYAGVPLFSPDGFALGTLCALDSTPHLCTPRDLEVLTLLAQQVVEQMERRRDTRLLEETQVRVTRANEYLEATLELLQVGAMGLDEQGRVTFCNARGASLLGLDLDRDFLRSYQDTVQFNRPAMIQFSEMLAMPPELRRRLPLHQEAPGVESRYLEVEVRKDPRDPRHELVFIYDVSEVNDLRTRNLHQSCTSLLGASPAILDVLRNIQDVADGSWTVLIEGETGTGKELVAQAIHAASPRRLERFVAVNCGGLSESLLGSQLFGHRKGSFTGATTDHEGLFEAAHGGTLFLDEVGEFPLTLQAYLLRALQEKEIVRIGETRPKKVDVRIIAATNRDLAEEVKAGRFRADLLYRLKIARIGLPPLRVRTEDIPMLAQAFFSEARLTAGKAIRSMEPAVLEALCHYSWPGNVRELRSAIEQAVIHCRQGVLRLEDLPTELVLKREHVLANPQPPLEPRGLIGVDERTRFLEAIQQARGSRKKAAELLGISRATFYRKAAALGLDLHQIP